MQEVQSMAGVVLLSTIADQCIRREASEVLAVLSTRGLNSQTFGNFRKAQTMAKSFYMRTMVAGRYRKIIRYTRPLPNDNNVIRQAKTAATNAAQRYINIKNSTEKLQLLLCANFDRKDACFCTFTFDDDSLPDNRKHAKNIIAATFRALKKEFTRHEKDLKYIYVVEGESLSSAPNAVSVTAQPWEVAPWREQQRWTS